MSAPPRDALLFVGSASLVLPGARVAYALARSDRLARPGLGRRGLERTRALEESSLFARIEPAIAFVAALLGTLPLSRVRAGVELRLSHAGSYLGLCADEFLALSLVSCVGCGQLALVSLSALKLPTAIALPCALLGGALPFERVRSHTRARNRLVARKLPPTIDLLALCMNAGLDFVGALELVTRELGDPHDPSDPLQLECHQLLRELAMGHTRSEALAQLAARVPVPAVREFVAAVIQAEQAGTPLVSVLTIQARTLRMHRSVAAEEAAARASVLLVLPMTLLLAAIVLVMLGPFIVNGIGL